MFRYVLKEFFSVNKSYLLVFLATFEFLLSLISPYLNGRFIDFLLTNRNERTILVFAVIVMSANISSVLLSYVSNILSMELLSVTVYRVLSGEIRRIERSNLQDIEKFESGYLTQRMISDAHAITSFVLQHFLTFVLNGLILIFTLLIFLRTLPSMLFLVLFFAPIYVVLYWALKKPLYNASLLKKEADSTFYNAVNARLVSVETTKLRNSHERTSRRTGHMFNVLLNHTLNLSRLNYFYSSADGVISIVFQSAMLIIGGISIVRRTMTIGDFLIINAYFGMTMRTIRYYLDFLKTHQSASASYSRMLVLQSIESERSGSVALKGVSSVELRSLGFSYNCITNVFEEFDLLFNKKGLYVVVGPNGSGKSTLLRLVTGLYQRYSGQIIVDGTEMRELDLDHYRRRCLSVSLQRIVLDKTTVKEYIEGQLDPAHIEKRMDKAPFQSDVKASWDRNCDSLSGGERRKLSLWLCFQKDADVFILDEPTEGLDDMGKGELITYLKWLSKHRIVIVMTHDQDVIAAATEKVNLRHVV